MRLLEREGLWTMTEAVYLPSTVQFTTDRSVLDNISASHPDLHYIIVGLLRMYNTIFHYPTHVREFAIARRLRLKHEQIIAALQKMHLMGILEYNAQGQGPQLFFHHRRVDSSHLLIDMNRINTLKQRHIARTEKMLSFLYNKEVCREKFVLNYFGEADAKDCGHCDVCRSKRAPKPVLTLKQQLFRQITEGTYTLPDILATHTDADRQQLVQMVRELIDEGIVQQNASGCIQFRNSK